MSNEQQWIPLSGPCGRLPTEADADNEGNVWFNNPRHPVAQHDHWECYHDSIAFMPIPKRLAPPLPKPVEKTQEEKDNDMFLEVIKGGGTHARQYILKAIRYGRSDGRAQLAREALGLFNYPRFNLVAIADHLEVGNMDLTAETVRKLHALLTKALQASAAEETP